MDAKPVDAEQFKVGMRTLAGAVNIITSLNGGHRYGMTATAVCSATAEPPTVLACINKLATTHGAVAKSKAFCVNVLRAEDWELSTTFSGAQSGESRFKSRDWARLATGSPVVKSMAHGTHTIFLGQVEQVLIGKKGKPLLYSEGQYAKLASLTLGEPLPEGLDYWGF
jgi:flavin reductase (DIM6/NTAB) family NADH-FMN oxidoreductase RutF